jgi:hypothetical protein
VCGDIESQLQAAPDPEFIESIPQVIFNHLFRSTDYLGDLAIGLAFPDQHRDLDFLGG